MTKIEKTMEVKAPIEKVFALCADVENYTTFMTGVKEISKTGDTAFHWKMDIAGRAIEFDTELVEAVENQKIAWESTGEFASKGSWSFEPATEGTTVGYVMDYTIPGIMGAIFDKVKVSKEVEKGMEESLQALKALLEGG